MSISLEAFALLVLDNATLTFSNGSKESGYLSLECVTISHPGGSSPQDRDVYLVLRLNTTETPLDPERIVQRSDPPGYRTYTFKGTTSDPDELTLSFKLPVPAESNPAYLEDLETFEGILSQYHNELRGAPTAAASTSGGAPSQGESSNRSLGHVTIGGTTKNEKELRGHLVMVDEKSGEVLGQVEDRFRIQEDPTMHTAGHENDPVIIEVQDGATSDAQALECFARIVTPDQANWITNTATVVSSAISLTTNLAITTITAASNYYIKHSQPSPHASRSATPAEGTSKDGSAPLPLPPRPRALVFLTSDTTKKNLHKAHAFSGQAVKVSAKTVSYIDGIIRKAVGRNGPKRTREERLQTGAYSSISQPGTPAPAYSPSPSLSGGAQYPAEKSQGGLGAPPFPPRRATSPAPPLPPRAGEDAPRRLSNKDRILISADLILSTIDHSTRQLLDVGTSTVGRVMEHKYGKEAGESSLLMANTARNVGLVYVDLHGIGRRALLKRAGKEYVKSKFSSSNKQPASPAPPPKV